MKRLLKWVVAYVRTPEFPLPFGLAGRVYWGRRGPSVNIHRRRK